MWDTPAKKVVVGVEDADCDAALRVAAAEARGRRCGIHLVHVVTPVYVGPPELSELTSIALGIRRAGEAVLAEARHRLVRLLGEDAGAISVSTELCHSSVVPALVAAGAHAHVLVLMHRGMGPGGHTRRLSVTLGVAARARVPVLAVPDTWAAEPSAETLTVTVGVVDPTASSGVVRAAVREADRMGARVRLVHAAGLPQADEGRLDEGSAETAAALRRLAREFEAGFVQACRERPHVPVEVEVVPQTPEVALIERAWGSSLLVVGRHHSRLPLAPRLGHVVRAVLRRASCPVLVIEPGPLVVPEHRDLATVAIP
jgi:nucleotide-binding universal stress UspA family protein